MSRKSEMRSHRTTVLVIGLLVLAGIWLAEQFARAGAGPDWMDFFFAGTGQESGLSVGLVAGHHGNDSGAICPDGLTEAEVNLRVTELVARRLNARGIRTDLLEEFDDRLDGYRADAFVSIHADSCAVQHSGFKVASPEGGSEASQRLAECLWDHYESETALARHPQTITPDMTCNHAFGKISPQTPGAIIELGFLNADRDLLVGDPDRLAAGVAAGILCFLTESGAVR